MNQQKPGIKRTGVKCVVCKNGEGEIVERYGQDISLGRMGAHERVGAKNESPIIFQSRYCDKCGLKYEFLPKR